MHCYVYEENVETLVTFEPKTLQILMPILRTLTKIIEISGNTETFSNVSPSQMLLFLNDQ